MKPYTKYWECRMPVIVCQETRKSKAESALRRIGRTPLLQSSWIFRTGAGQSEQRFYKDVTNGTKIVLGVLQKSMTKVWKQPFFELCCAPHKLLLCCLSTEHSRETRQLSTLLYKTLTGVYVWKLYLRQKMCLRICLWIFLSIDDNSWKQLLTPATFYCFAPSNSKCKHDKKEPLANLSKSCCHNRPFHIAKGTSLELHLASQDGFRGVA